MKLAIVSRDPPAFAPYRAGLPMRPRSLAAPIPDTPPKVDLMTVVWDLCEHHNQLRQAASTPGRVIPLLSIAAALFRVADRFAAELAARDELNHVRRSGIPFYEEIYTQLGYQAYCGENAAMGQFTVTQVMASWRASPPHYANIIDHRYIHFGASLRFAADGTPLWVVDLSA